MNEQDLDRVEKQLQVKDEVDVSDIQQSMSAKEFADFVKRVNQDEASSHREGVSIHSDNGKTYLTRKK